MPTTVNHLKNESVETAHNLPEIFVIWVLLVCRSSPAETRETAQASSTPPSGLYRIVGTVKFSEPF